MAERKREDPATLGDLQDLAEQTRTGFTDALKDALGKVIPGPAPKGDPPAGDPPAGDPPAGDPPKTDFGFGGRWWGGSKQ